MTEQKPSAAGGGAEQPATGRRSTEPEIAHAIDLGWRVAALHALSPTTLAPIAAVSDDMLLNRRSLSAADRLELELRAIAGVAQRAGAPIQETQLESALALAQVAGDSDEGERAFRDEVARRHVAIEKQLWATHEPSGKAYELGNFLSDTWNRILLPRIHPEPHAELAEIFHPVRVARIKLLLDDLQARVDPVAVHAVTNHLEEWDERVRNGTLRSGRGPAEGLTMEQNVQRLEPVERQTLIWRQMLTGDKEPEAWIGQQERAEARDQFTKQIWSRYRRKLIWIVPLLIVVGAGLGWLYSGHPAAARSLGASALAVAGAFGVTRASMIAALRRGAQNWGDLMWNRALAAVICRTTSVVYELYLPPAQPARGMARRLRGVASAQRTNSTSTVSPASTDSRSSGTNA
jgi:hypothetical protein